MSTSNLGRGLSPSVPQPRRQQKPQQPKPRTPQPTPRPPAPPATPLVETPKPSTGRRAPWQQPVQINQQQQPAPASNVPDESEALDIDADTGSEQHIDLELP
eukprot:6181085-Pleurochrysis_carterae.AAC.1